MEGILLVDKPKGWTSFDVVAKIRGLIKQRTGQRIKIGHTGTLDPAATGLLILCVGKKYTKKVQDLIKHDKTYTAEITFGATSTTGDVEGELLEDKKKMVIEQSVLEKVMKDFIGTIKQIPPSYSAVKVNGKRAYELARARKKVEIAPREVTIYDIEINKFNWPVVNITCKVGSGTYIRTLAEDIGKSMGVGAYLSNLRRTDVDKWSVDNAVSPIDISIDIIKEKLLV